MTYAEAVEERRNIAAGYERGVQQLHEEAVAEAALQARYDAEGTTTLLYTPVFGGAWYRRVGIGDPAVAEARAQLPRWAQWLHRAQVWIMGHVLGHDHIWILEEAQ